MDVKLTGESVIVKIVQWSFDADFLQNLVLMPRRENCMQHIDTVFYRSYLSHLGLLPADGLRGFFSDLCLQYSYTFSMF